MPQRPAFTGQRRDFITAHKAGYAAAVKAGTQKDFVANFQRAFFNRWDPLLPLDVERSQEDLDAVDDSVPAKEYPVPLPPEEGSENFEEALEKYRADVLKYEEFKKVLELRKGQIERRLKADYVRDQTPGSSSKKIDLKNPFIAVTLQLSGGQLAKPRLTPAPLYWKENNNEFVTAIYHKRKEIEKPENKDIPQLFQRVLKEEWEKLSAEVQKEWEEKAKTAHKGSLSDWEQAKKGTPSTRPEDRQRAINGLARFMQPILDGICAATGMSCTLIVGGPEPADNGRLNAMAIHAGATTTGNVNMNWGQSELATWKKVIFPSMGVWLKKCYSVEECRSRALPSEAEGDDGMDIDTDDQVFTFSVEEGEVGGASAAPTDKPMDSSDLSQAPVSTSKAAGSDNPKESSSSEPAATSSHSRAASVPPSGPPASPRASPSPGDVRSTTPLMPASPLPPSSPGLGTSFSVPSPVHSPNLSRLASIPPSSPIPSSPHLSTTTSPPPSNASLPSDADTDTLRIPSEPESEASGLSGRRERSAHKRDAAEILEPETTSSSSKRARTAAGVSAGLKGSRPRPGPASKRPPRALPTGGKKTTSSSSAPKQPSEIPSKRVYVEIEKKIVRKKLTAEPKPSESASMPIDNGKPVVPSEAHSYAHKTLALAWNVIPLKVVGFEDLLKLWVRFEAQEGFVGTERLGARGRPKWVADWNQRARNPTYLPETKDPNALVDGFWIWWKSLQPAWREFSENCRPLDRIYHDADGDVEVLRVGGQNGMASVVACMAYCAYAVHRMPIENSRDAGMQELLWEELAAAARDVSWVLRALVTA
ncbi:hypothetical protein V5O48_014451 [Marasmius crinis-equi]|uniref:HMG box domain-containing protein n=1 Tax=Marasmius crinis-equi TaxID=585013 RepID=A0ABR3EXC6_9AGAR